MKINLSYALNSAVSDGVFYSPLHLPQEKVSHVRSHNCDLYNLVAEWFQFVLTANRIYGNRRKTRFTSCMYMAINSVINGRMCPTVRWNCVEIVCRLFSKWSAAKRRFTAWWTPPDELFPIFFPQVLAQPLVSEHIENETCVGCKHACTYVVREEFVGWKQTMRVLCTWEMFSCQGLCCGRIKPDLHL